MAKQINDRLRNVLVCLGIAFLFLVLSYGFVPQVLGGTSRRPDLLDEFDVRRNAFDGDVR